MNNQLELDKYEGHAEGEWTIEINDTGDECAINAQDYGTIAQTFYRDSDKLFYATSRLIADAPLLLAEVERLRKTNEFHMMLDAEETKEQLKLQKENDNLTKLCIERYAEVKRLREAIADVANNMEAADPSLLRSFIKDLLEVIE